MLYLLKEYFAQMLLVASFVAFALGVVHPRMRSSASLGAGVLIICVILLPIVDIIKGYHRKIDIDDYVSFVESNTDNSAVETAFEDGIRQYIVESYGVSVNSVTVTVDGFDLERVRAERIYVTLSGDAVRLDYKRIKEAIESEFTDGGECEVSLRLG